MNRLLFPSDLSDISQKALRFTLDFAKEFSSEVSVLHAFDPGKPISRWLKARKRRNIIWEKMVNFTQDEDGVIPPHVSLMIRKGPLDEQISKASQNGQFRFIVMGKKHSYSAFLNILGTKTSKVMASANCPLLMIPAGAKFKGIRNILIVDGEYRKLEKVVQQNILMLSLRFGADLHYINISKDPSGWGYKREILTKDNFFFQKSIPEGFAVEAIVEYMQQNEMDLIVMRTSRRQLFEQLFSYSYQNGCLHSTDVPLLVFHSNYLNWWKENEEKGGESIKQNGLSHAPAVRAEP